MRIIQCKYWASQKTVHEKHVCQIFGSAAMYELQACHGDPAVLGKQTVSGWLYTSCSCSDVAKDFAKILGIKIKESIPLDRYPVIKCHVSKRTGEKIYHLPFDQQYDRTILDGNIERYVSTIAEAEELGFRRAYRWHGPTLA